MDKKILLFIIFFCIFTLVACNENSETINFLADSECSPPCLYSIIPGKSNTTEVKSNISSIPNIHDIFWKGPWAIYSDIVFFKFLPSGQECETTFSNHVVDHILLYQQLNINIGQIFELYGEPQTILVSNQKNGGTKVHQVNILYPKKGIVLSYDINPFIKSIKIKPYFKIKYIIFVNPDTFNQFIISSPLIGQLTEEYLAYRQFDWKGYTTYTISK